MRCNTTFKPKHATRAAAHFAKKKRIGIKACPAIVPDADLKRYCDLFDSIVGKTDKRKHGADALMDLATQRQDTAAFSLNEKKLNPPSALSIESSRKSPQHGQSSINGLLDRMHQTDIRTTILAHHEMAIADLMYCENLPDRVVESSRFKLVLQHACFVDSKFKVPSCKKIGGQLLDINYKNCMEINKQEMMKDAPIFGLFWLSNLSDNIKNAYYKHPCHLR